MKKILLTGDRPTGPLHLGHYIGSLQNRLLLQESCETYIMLADAQALTDNYDDINKVRTNIHEVTCDYLAVGIDPKKSHIFIQSCLPELPEMAMYYMNLVTIQHLGHNPTVKAECKMRGFNEGVPAGFYLYPIYQVADITAFKANIVPVGLDQAPMLELTRDIVRKFNALYKKDLLVVPEALYPKLKGTLPGVDGQKMSKSLGNAIYLSDERETIIAKVKKMKSDPGRLSATDPGDPEKAIAFSYLDVFAPDESLKEQYRRGAISDKAVKEQVIEVLDAFVAPIRERRKQIHEDRAFIQGVLAEGTQKAQEKTRATLHEMREAMGIDYEWISRRTVHSF